MRFVRVDQCSAEGDGIRVGMLGEDQELHQFEVSSSCAPLLAAALTAEVQKLNVQDQEQQFLRPIGMQTAVTDKGEPMILMALEGGAELPLVFKAESLGVLVSELQGLMANVQPRTEMRWQ